jgi:hypothetical protein
MPVSFFMPQVVKAQLQSVQKCLVSRKDNSADPYTGVIPWKKRKHPCLHSEKMAVARWLINILERVKVFLILLWNMLIIPCKFSPKSL